MFVTFETTNMSSPYAEHNGNTISILETISSTEYRVGRYDSRGQWCEWIAKFSELKGF